MALLGTLTSGVSAMRSFTKALEVIGNNISNVNTTAFKSSTVSFSDSFSNTLKASSASATQVGTGVQISKIDTNFTQGSLSTTGVTTDLAISGSGFFLVKDPVSGTTYATRCGDFSVDDEGYLVTADGYRVQGATGGTDSADPSTYGDIQIGANVPTDTELSSYSISSTGSITEFYSDGTSVVTNQVLLQSYSNTSALTKEGNNLYSGFEAAGIIGDTTPTVDGNTPGSNGLGTITSGALELSNVDLTDEFSNMITTQRSFQAASRLITVSDTMLEDIVNLKR